MKNIITKLILSIIVILLVEGYYKPYSERIVYMKIAKVFIGALIMVTLYDLCLWIVK